MSRPNYDCDTFPYWCSEEDYNNRSKRFGEFLDGGAAYRIGDPNTPRPWLNYFANHKFGSVTSNRGLGFTWFRSTLLRITKYEHPIDYLPREFQDGREIIVTDLATDTSCNLLREARNLVCTHRPGWSTIQGSAAGLDFTFTLFVPLEDACELWLVEIMNRGREPREFGLAFQQTWSFAKFGIHTAEEGIPYISTPGRDFEAWTDLTAVYGHTTNPDLPYEMWGAFLSPDAESATCEPLAADRPDGRRFVFHRCALETPATLGPGERRTFQVASGAEVSRPAFDALCARYREPGSARAQLDRVRAQWQEWIQAPSCRLPDPDLQNFLNAWFKNQLHLTFHFVRSGHNGYRDSLQDAWGYALLDPVRARARLLEILSHQNPDGTAPRNFSAFGDGVHDNRRYMDSPVWIARTLADLVVETGEFSLLDEQVPFLNGEPATVDEHLWRALDHLYRGRGAHGACITGEGDWNDALEGIGKHGDAESVWLTIALYDAMCRAAALYAGTGRGERAAELRARAEELKKVVNEQAWDGEWYVYGFTGTGAPIGSSRNREGRIHL
ncbi:MAG: hypothetical protein JXB04_07545, partial [Kiritimatiellae bacterium]|nr:hypothetical protein [Kiritimatiellia bacterium]